MEEELGVDVEEIRPMVEFEDEEEEKLQDNRKKKKNTRVSPKKKSTTKDSFWKNVRDNNFVPLSKRFKPKIIKD